jgi:hypothetical protein
MHTLVIVLIVLAVLAGAVYFLPNVRKFVLVRLGLQHDLEYALSGMTKLVNSLEAHAKDEEAKAAAFLAAHEASLKTAVKASNVASNVKNLIGA